MTVVFKARQQRAEQMGCAHSLYTLSLLSLFLLLVATRIRKPRLSYCQTLIPTCIYLPRTRTAAARYSSMHERNGRINRETKKDEHTYTIYTNERLRRTDSVEVHLRMQVDGILVFIVGSSSSASVLRPLPPASAHPPPPRPLLLVLLL